MIPTMTEYNVSNLDGLLVYVATEVPAFSYMLLFVLFLIISLGTYFGTKKMRGDADIWASMAVGSFAATTTAFVMTIIPGLIGIDLLIYCVVFNLLFVILFLVNRER